MKKQMEVRNKLKKEETEKKTKNSLMKTEDSKPKKKEIGLNILRMMFMKTNIIIQKRKLFQQKK